MNSFFTRIATRISEALGTPYAFIAALTSIIVWGIAGPVFKFSETWQLVINTGTTIITFLAVFLIQNAQNRDNKALQLKLDIIILSIEKADNKLLAVEDLEYKQLEKLRQQLIQKGKKQDEKDTRIHTSKRSGTKDGLAGSRHAQGRSRKA